MTFKKLLSIAFSVILIISLLSSCKKPNSPTIENVSSKEEKVENTVAQTIEKTDVEAIYKLGADINVDSSEVDIKVADSIAHLFFDMGETTQVVSFSVYENSVLGTATLTGESLYYGVLDAGEYYAVNLQTATLFLFEKNGKLKRETKLCDSALIFAVMDMTGQFVIYQKTDSTHINRYDILTNETKESSENFNIAGTPASDKEAVYVKDNTGKHYSVNFTDFTFKKTQSEAFREYVDCIGFATEGEYFTHTALKAGSTKYMSKYSAAGEKVIAAQEERFITLSAENDYLRLYNNETGFAIGEIKAGGKVLDAQFVEDKYIFIALENEDTSENFYRLFDINENQTKDNFETGRLEESKIYENVFGYKETETTKAADKIVEEHKVRFLYGDVGEEFKTGFTYQKADGVDVAPKLKIAEKIFDVLPSELLMEATANREIWVYFCNQLDNKGTEYSKLATLTDLYNHKLILIDAKCNDEKFAELLCHEFAHILDDYMPQSVKDGFSKLTPENVKAANTNDYINVSSDQYTPYDEDKNNVWFFNNYCRINEKEDRTVTLGQMFKNYAVQSSGEQFAFENVKKKAGYLSKALEESFEYCKEADNQLWELAYPYSE